MIANAGRPQLPFAAAVRGGKNDAPRAADHQARTVFHVETIKRRVSRTFLFFPLETAVAGGDDGAVCADRPAVTFVSRESDRVDSVSLWQWILPLPAAKWILRVNVSS